MENQVPIINHHPIEFYCDKIKNNEYFKFIRYGDAEWMFYLKSHQNGSPMNNGEMVVYGEMDYDNEISNQIIKTIDLPKESDSYFYSLQSLSVRLFGNKIPQLNWHYSDVFHFGSIENKLLPFLKLIKERKLVFIGANYLRKIGELLPVEHFIEVPEKNCYTEKDRILKDIKDYGKSAIYLFQCSVLSCILLYELDIPESFMLDLGSLLDPFVGKNSRTYHHDIAKNGVLDGYIRDLK